MTEAGKRFIHEAVTRIKESLKGATILGEQIDLDDIDQLVFAAYWQGQEDANKKRDAEIENFIKFQQSSRKLFS